MVYFKGDPTLIPSKRGKCTSPRTQTKTQKYRQLSIRKHQLKTIERSRTNPTTL